MLEFRGVVPIVWLIWINSHSRFCCSTKFISHHRILQPPAPKDIFADPGEASSFLGPWLVLLVYDSYVYNYHCCYDIFGLSSSLSLSLFCLNCLCTKGYMANPNQVSCSECPPTVAWGFLRSEAVQFQNPWQIRSSNVDLYYSVGTHNR